MSIVKSIHIAGLAGCVASIATMVAVTVRAEDAGQKRIEAPQWPAAPTSTIEPKRVRTVVIRPDAGQRRIGQEPAAPPQASTPPPTREAQQKPGASAAEGFNFARYQFTDLDEVMEQRRPAQGIDLYPALPLKFRVALASYAEPCSVDFLKKSMIAAGIPKETVAAAPIMRCIKVRTAEGRLLPLFIQDPVAKLLSKEVPLGRRVTLYAIHLFTGSDGPGLLVNEFFSNGCGSPNNPGVDLSGPVGAAIRAADEGVVVKVEENEQALVDTPSAGPCGRYVVIKHTYPNGRSVFTRYAQLGPMVGANGAAMAAGVYIIKGGKIGEVGSEGGFHFEVRPVDPATMDASETWSQRYGADPTMEWSRFQPVDPKTFDFNTFGAKSGGK